MVYWAEAGELLYAHLQRGNASPSKKATWVLDKSLRLVPEGMSVRLRGDSAFYTRAFLGECERREIIFAITDDQTKALRAAVAALRETTWGPDRASTALS